MGCARHSRHQFGGWRGGKIWAVALAIATTVKAGAGVVDRSALAGNSVVAAPRRRFSGRGLLAVLPGRGVQHIFASRGACLFFAVKAAKIGLTATLFLIGSGISVQTIKRVGYRPLLQGIVLWVLVSVGSLWLIRWDGLRCEERQGKRRAKLAPKKLQMPLAEHDCGLKLLFGEFPTERFLLTGRWRERLGFRVRRGLWHGFCIVVMDCRGSACWARVERLSCAATTPSSSGCGWRPKGSAFADARWI
jgi:hypothetical protein